MTGHLPLAFAGTGKYRIWGNQRTRGWALETAQPGLGNVYLPQPPTRRASLPTWSSCGHQGPACPLSHPPSLAFPTGKLKPVIKSQPVPKNNKGPVKVVVGKTFDSIVMDPKKDVLIEFYAPWCGHCKQLEPVYTSLGKKYKGHKNLVIAKMDATANDVSSDRYKVEGFPTIYFAPSGDKKNPIKFEDGNRDLEHLSKFIEEHATKLSRTKEEL